MPDRAAGAPLDEPRAHPRGRRRHRGVSGGGRGEGGRRARQQGGRREAGVRLLSDARLLLSYY